MWLEVGDNPAAHDRPLTPGVPPDQIELCLFELIVFQPALTVDVLTFGRHLQHHFRPSHDQGKQIIKGEQFGVTLRLSYLGRVVEAHAALKAVWHT